MRETLTAVAIYAAAVPVLAALAAGLPDHGQLADWIAILSALALPALTFFVSHRLAVRTQHSGLLLPLLAYWVGATLGTAIAYLFLKEAFASSWSFALIRPITLGLLSEPVGNPAIFGIGGREYGLGIPWALVLIELGASWRPAGRSGTKADPA